MPGELKLPRPVGAQVRVINNVKKQQEVKPNFHEAFKQDGYPSVLPYQQKVRAVLSKSEPDQGLFN